MNMMNTVRKRNVAFNKWGNAALVEPVPFKMPNGQLRYPAQNCWVTWQWSGTWTAHPDASGSEHLCSTEKAFTDQ